VPRMINYEIAIDQFELFILILMRIASFIYVAPFFNTANTPRRLKIGLAFFITVIVYSLHSDMTVSYDSVIGYAVLVVEEVVIGLLLGAMTSFCVQIIMFSGKIIDMEIGVSMAQIYDPTTRIQVGIMGNFYYYILLLMLIVSGLYRYLIAAIVETYNVIPVGGVKFGTSIYKTVIDFMSDYFIIGFRIALPVFATMLLFNCILGILARIAPQMNMFVVGMQLKIFAGIMVIFFTVVMMNPVCNFITNEIKTIMSALVRGMS
jgi:flagellar biosynthetic protein FliR